MQSVTLIIDKRLEMSTKYKKLLETSLNKVMVSKNLLESIKIIKDLEPDLIIISDSFDSDLSDFCKQVRALTYNMRPVIVALSKSADSNDRIKVLNSGADDFLSEPVNLSEFKVRISAHLRREYESNLDLKQFLPNKNYTLRAIKRIISQKTAWSMLYIKIENFEDYKTAYTQLASDKLLQTYSAIIKATLTENDFVGLIDEDSYLIITDNLKAETVAKFLTYAFDTVVNKFYPEHDLNRGYIILQGDDFAGKRVNFVHVTISGISSENSSYNSVAQILNNLSQLNSMANLPDKSNYIIDRPKISGENSVRQRKYNNKIVIYESDQALCTLLNTILDLQGYDIKIMNTYEVPKFTDEPALLIIDAGDLEKQNGLNLCYQIKSSDNFTNTKVVVTSAIHDKELVLNTGADLYIPKPYEIPTLIKWVDSLVKEYNQ